tara:strand:+ start:10490 stop:11032 length:543 start_codon:yes stop_codon:yes gene_type:complete
MACELANGRLEVCKDAVGGIDAIYFINYGDYAYPTDITQTDDVIDAVANVTSLYKYELKGTNSFEQVFNTSRDNGTSFVEQTLSVVLKKQDASTHKSVKLLAYGRPHVIVKNRNNQFFLAGLEHGMELTTAAVANGTAMGDLVGYTLTFVGTEKVLANIIDVATEAELITAFGTATVITA